MSGEDKRGFVCSKCGAPLLGDEPLGEQCLACLLDAALDQEEGSAPDAGLFDHYRLATHPDGTTVELGRGAMGVTYKAVDINLHCTVTLKLSVNDISVMKRQGFAFCVKPVQRRASVIPMLPRSSTWADPGAVIFMRWSLWRERPLSI